VLTAILGAVIAFVFFEWVLGRDGGPLNITFGLEVNQILFLSYFAAIIGYFIGLGYFNYPIKWLLGHRATPEEQLWDYGVGPAPPATSASPSTTR
jgi:hypothetical protein